MAETLIAVLLILLTGAVLWAGYALRKAAGRPEDRMDSLRAELSGAIAANSDKTARELSSLTRHVSDQLSSLYLQLQTNSAELNRRMDAASRLFGDLGRGLGELSKASERILEVGKDISGLNDILRAPKPRGGFGETMLSDILAQCLPSRYYELQKTLGNGTRVDAAIDLNGRVLPVDSKFPLEGFRKLSSASTDEERASARKRFLADCRKHIDAISSSYVLPGEGTFSFALMYIPAENVYYEAVLRGEDPSDGLAEYAFSKKVIPVSPNSFYAYLQTILIGLRGAGVSERAEEMLRHIDGIRKDFVVLSEELSVLGRHISNAKSKYDDVQRRSERFGLRLEAASGTSMPENPAETPSSQGKPLD